MSSVVRVLAIALVVSAAVFSAVTPLAQTAPPRLIAVGDIHGALDSLVSILRTTGLIDEQNRWIGGRARLVQTGDFLDRGPSDREVMELLMRLEEEAKRAGGRVEVLFGNHEGMNILHDFRDVSPDAYRTFADANSESRRTKGFTTHATMARRSGRELNRNDWLRDHPPGFIEYAEAMGPTSKFGRWLRARKVVAKIDDSVFMHAGIPLQSSSSIDDINRAVQREVRSFDDAVSMLQSTGVIPPFFTLQEVLAAAPAELNRLAASLREGQEPQQDLTQDAVGRLQRLLGIRQWTLVDPDGPLWFRGYAMLAPDAQPQIEAVLKRLGAARFVVGHTPQLPGRITPRFENRVFLIDTGMLTTVYRGGRPSALEIAGDRITAVYTDERQELQTPDAVRR